MSNTFKLHCIKIAGLKTPLVSFDSFLFYWPVHFGLVLDRGVISKRNPHVRSAIILHTLDTKIFH